MITVVPGDSAPGKEVLPPGTAEPLTVIVKSLAHFVPPYLLSTCLITISLGALSSLVIVQVLTSPGFSVTEPFESQSPLNVAA